MALVNHAKKEINAKIVYFGPAGSGKSTALQYIFSRIKPSLRGELKNVPAGVDNLLFFDFSPFDGPLSGGYRVRLHVYTLTGRVTNPATWKMTLKGTDGLMIMLDDSPDRISDNQESISQLRDFLSVYGVGLHDTSAVLQLNRFDQEQVVVDAEQLASSLDLAGLPYFHSYATRGEGVLEALTALSKLVLDRVTEKDSRSDEKNIEELPGVDSEGVLVLSEDTSGDKARNSSGVTASKSQTGLFPPVSLSCQGAIMEGAMLRIPLDISCSGTDRRVIVTVTVAEE
ncbi:MAG: hypothetical protein PHD54_01010 [Desulfuromonadaceae bacterium]|nr:hypothetical protein [Desulfuromonadaceae bacterium]